jgi:phthiodiolone/phenolphthiodiolone dimycocerosates ketoreductase
VTRSADGGQERSRLRVGLRVPPIAPSERLRRFVARCVAAGVDSLWWPDHLMAFAAPSLWPESPPDLAAVHVYADPFAAMAWCGDLLGDVMVGTCVTDAIRRSPASLAQSAMTVDWAVRGRVVLGLGAGERANYAPYGIFADSPAQVFDRAARQIRSLIDDPGPDDAGAILGLRPRDPRCPPALWLASHGPRGQSLTGQVADGWFPTQLDVESWIAGRNVVRDAAVASRRDPAAVCCALALDVVLADSRAEAVALLSHPVVRASCLVLPPSAFARHGAEHPLGRSAMDVLVPTLDGARLGAAAALVPEAVVRETVIHGEVDDVVAAISGYPGLDHVRLSDLAGAVRPGRGGLDRLTSVAAKLQGR